jgi:acyl-[acyl-carrier-protein]-phospholipid O-acyltransferase/long-chain-fatty-acid--[acyl-carrier-protein] ligase
MMAAAVVLLGLVAGVVCAAGYIVLRRGLGFRQALLYLPFKLAYRITDRSVVAARKADAPVVYAVVHQSRLDPALMLALLPADTLHILDPLSAKSSWLEPWRELARTIAFNAEHVFVSRRLVRHLRGRGRLAVYFPDMVEPDLKTFRLYRAVARIAAKAGASVVPIFIEGGRHLPSSYTPAEIAPRRLLPKLRVTALPALPIAMLMERSGLPTTASSALFDYVAEARFTGSNRPRGLFTALTDAASRFGPAHPAVSDAIAGTMNYRRLLIGARIIGHRLTGLTAPGETVGVMLPNSNAVAVTLAGLASSMRAAAMINYTSGEANVTAAIRTAVIRTVVSSRSFVEKAALAPVVAAAEQGGARFLWLEDVQAGVTSLDKLAAALSWRRPLARQRPDAPAVVLFTSGSEGLPKAVVLTHRNVIANAMQIQARIAFSPQDTLFNVLPVFHSFGLTGGTILPLVTGVKLFLYPSPLHYKLIPETAAKVRPTILFGTDTFLQGYARSAKDSDFDSLRLVVAGAEPVKPQTRAVWRERFGAEIVEGFGLTEAAPVAAVNSSTHNREGSVGRLLPGMRMRLEPVEGITEGGRLWIRGPNVMAGYMSADLPGVVQPLAEGWHDTGDIVAVDREGFLFIRGRAKRFAKIAGEMVSLGAVEMLVSALWPENHHAVVSLPDHRRGERIVLVTTASDADATTLRRYGRKLGASDLMVPQDIVAVEAIPLLGTGKVDYATSREIALERLGKDEAAA